MSIKDEFIETLIEELNDINVRRIDDNKQPIDVCYMVSVIDQQIENYKEFLDDIAKNTYYINRYDEGNSNGYTNGKIEIVISKSDEERPYTYIIDFLYDERYRGYCQCTSDMEGYNEEYDCCGHDCDWVAPAFTLTKKIGLGYSRWEGYEKDYWEYEKKFELNEKNKNKEVEKFLKEQEKQYLKDKIEELQNKLEMLNE